MRVRHAPASTPGGRSSIDVRQARPSIVSRFGLIRWISPAKPCRIRLSSTDLPSAPGVGDAPTIASRIQALLDFDSRDQLDRIKVETLLIGAIDDAVTPHHLWDELAEGIEGAKMVKLPEGGHFCPQTAADAYNTNVMNFLQGGK